MRFSESLYVPLFSILIISTALSTRPRSQRISSQTPPKYTLTSSLSQARRLLSSSLSSLKSGAGHIWTGVKLYGYEVNTGSRLFWKLIKGGQLSYREKKQLSRAVNDTSRLIPFTIFAIIPFSELTLPFVLKVATHSLFEVEIPELLALDLHLGGQKRRHSSEHSRSAPRPRPRILRPNESHREEASP